MKVFFALISLNLLVSYCYAQRNPKFELLELAAKEVDAQHYQNAVNLLDDFMAKDTTDYFAYYLRGEAQWHITGNSQVLDDFNHSLRLNPRYSDAYYNRALWESANTPEIALSDCNQAIKYNINSKNLPNLYSLRGSVRIKLLDWIGAKTDILKCLELDKTYSTAWRDLGEVYLNNNQFEQAISALDKSISLYQEDAFAYFYRGQAKAKSNKTESACLDFERARKLIETNQFDETINKYCH